MTDTVTPFAYRVKSIKKIIDGDTFDCILDLGFDVLLEARVRMAGIDTPESRTRDLTEKKFGLASKEYLVEKINNAEDIIVRTELDNEKGKFGRILGTAYLDGVNINQQMIDEHYAVSYHGQSKDDIEAQHIANRQILIEAGAVAI
tara:strand:+ start:211 stop:648 length:438 start_codon:yes stop_codon:yes gene_type:complete